MKDVSAVMDHLNEITVEQFLDECQKNNVQGFIDDDKCCLIANYIKNEVGAHPQSQDVVSVQTSYLTDLSNNKVFILNDWMTQLVLDFDNWRLDHIFYDADCPSSE